MKGDKLLYAGGFLALFSGYLWMKGPAVNSAQFTFRIGLLIVGLLLSVIGFILQQKGR